MKCPTAIFHVDKDFQVNLNKDGRKLYESILSNNNIDISSVTLKDVGHLFRVETGESTVKRYTMTDLPAFFNLDFAIDMVILEIQGNNMYVYRHWKCGEHFYSRSLHYIIVNNTMVYVIISINRVEYYNSKKRAWIVLFN